MDEQVALRAEHAVPIPPPHDFEELRGRNGVRMRPEGDLMVIEADGAEPLYLARHLDCLLLGNEQGLVTRSYELAAGVGDPDSFGGSASTKCWTSWSGASVCPSA